MTTNEAIARWAGMGDKDYLPDYEHSDAAAITLLPVLVERGLAISIASHGKQWAIGIAPSSCDLDKCIDAIKPTIAAAICAAVMELIAKGEQG